MRYLFLILGVTLSFFAHGAELLEPGDVFPGFEARDQHDLAYSFAPGVNTVLVSFDMATGRRANRFLARQGADYLPDHEAIYIANIYGMPGIGRMFALPKMRKYPHRILLADSGNQLARFPREEDRVTVVRLNDEGILRAIEFWSPGEGTLDL